MKRILAIILAALMLTCMLAGCASKSDYETIKKSGEMTIGITIFAPMNYYENDKLIGFETEFAEAVCEKLGVKPNFQVIDWNAKETELNAKNIDCIWNGMTITEERSDAMGITDPYMENKQVMVVKKENLEKLSKSANGATVVAEGGSAGETLAKENEFFANAEYTAVKDMSTALLDVNAGTSDIAIVDYVNSIAATGEGTDFADLVVVDSLEGEKEEYGIAFRKDSDMVEKVNEIIDELIEDGTLEKIAEKYELGDLLIKD